MNQQAPQTHTQCYHCGDTCGSGAIEHEDKTFCCNGCWQVYMLLSENGLHQYYRLQDSPGQSQKEQASLASLAWLDDEQARLRLIEFRNEHFSRISLHLPQMHCASCIWLLENLHMVHKGIRQAKANMLRKELTVSFDEEQISLRQLVELLHRLGYPPRLTFENLDPRTRQQQAQKEKRKQFVLRLGVTGFCFGNIMLLSFPEYLGIQAYDGEFVRIFGYLNFLLSLPVLFYGGWEYMRSAWVAVTHRTVNIDVPLALGILAFFFRSSYEIFSQTGAGYFDSMAALIFLLLVGRWFQQKTFDNISFDRDYRSYFPVAVTLLAEGKATSVPLSRLKVGDEILVRNGELVPADSILTGGEAAIDYSFVTGESVPVRKHPGDLIYAGGRQRGGQISLKVSREVAQSYLTRLWNDRGQEGQTTAHQEENLLNEQTNQLGRYFTYAILLISFGGFFWWLPHDVGYAFNALTAVLIIACPCALALNVPFSLGNALRRLAAVGFFVRNTDAIERMARLTHLVFDKTGTITSGSTTASTTEGNAIWFEGSTLTPEEEQLIRAVAAQSLHPLSRQLAEWLPGASSAPEVRSFQEHEGQGVSATVKGQHIRLGRHDFVAEGAAANGQPMANPPSAAEATALSTSVWVAIEGQVKGRFRFRQHLRTGMKGLMERLSQRYRLSLLSGDNAAERPLMQSIFPASADLQFQCSPHQKQEHIRQLQENKATVAMIGDGLNDAGALWQSDVGIAVAENEHQFSPACDAIIGADKVHLLESYIRYARQSIGMTRIGFVLSLLYNVVGVTVAVQGELSPLFAAILMPLSSVMVVGMGVLGTTLLAGRLGKDTE